MDDDHGPPALDTEDTMRHQPRLGDLAYGVRQSVRRPPKPRPAETRPATPLPNQTPAESLELLSVIHPHDYRAICLLTTFALERQWRDMTREEQRAAVEEMDRRREAVKERPGSRLV